MAKPTQPTYTLTSLIGGVSEQSPQDRASNSAEMQENCLNIPLKGSVARPGFALLAAHSESFTDPFVHIISRSNSELYALLVESGRAVVVNMVTGAKSTLANSTAINAYLTHTGPAREAFDAVTVEDTTFIVNRERQVSMKADTSAARPNRALFYFKASAYSTTYKASIIVGGTAYTATYTTPDNSASSNAAYIATNSLAAALRTALYNLKASYPAALGNFSFTQSGSLVVVDGGATDYEVDSEDGQGDTHLIAFKQWVKKFSDLPSRCVDGYVVGVRGSVADQKSDYYLQYYGSPTTGYWQEVVAPSTQTTIDATTMPHTMVNTGVDTFNCVQPSWGTRLSGDGEKSAKDPTFVGKRITSISFMSGRLSLTTEGSFMLSRARNAYAYFPDTAQTRLDTDPLGYDVANGTVTIIKHSVNVSEHLFFWGDGVQIRHDTSDGTITEETSEATSSTSYEYDGRVKPVTIGAGTVVFGTEMGGFTNLLEVVYKSGTPVGELPITDHCPHFLEGSLRGLFANGAYRITGAITSKPSTLFVYQWFNSGDKRTQSAWNRWTFAATDSVVAGAMRGGFFYLLLQSGDRLLVERMRVQPQNKDEKYIRLDHRMDETFGTYSVDGSSLTITLPFSVPEADRSQFVAVENEDDDSPQVRGRTLHVEWNSETSATITLAEPNSKVWFGAIPKATRRFSQVYIQTDTGPVPAERLLLSDIRISHVESVEYIVRISDTGENVLYEHHWDGRMAIDPANTAAKLPLNTGKSTWPVDMKADECWIDLINETPFPSTWVNAEYSYQLTK